MKLPERIACPHCGADNRLGLGLCRKCMRHLPKIEDVKKDIQNAQKSKKTKSVKEDKPRFRFNLYDSEE